VSVDDFTQVSNSVALVVVEPVRCACQGSTGVLLDCAVCVGWVGEVDDLGDVAVVASGDRLGGPLAEGSGENVAEGSRGVGLQCRDPHLADRQLREVVEAVARDADGCVVTAVDEDRWRRDVFDRKPRLSQEPGEARLVRYAWLHDPDRGRHRTPCDIRRWWPERLG